jgi:hypothetical protein
MNNVNSQQQSKVFTQSSKVEQSSKGFIWHNRDVAPNKAFDNGITILKIQI